jgi:hypothetical protein
MKYRIEQIAGFTQKKDGTPYTDKYGKPAKNVVMTINGERVSYFDTQGVSRSWVAGMEIEGTIEEKNGFKNFYPARQSDPILREILTKVDLILLKLGGGDSKTFNASLPKEEPVKEVVDNSEELPF